MVKLAICADDFGLHPAINRAALQLAAAGRLNALACMSEAPAWPAGAAALRQHDFEAVDLGLHLNLTEPLPGGGLHMPLPLLLARTGLRSLPSQALRSSITQQLDRFELALGRAPDFIDGHQHVHQLPQVREALLEELQRRYPSRRPWLRHSGLAARAPQGASEPAPSFKERSLHLLGGQGLARLAQARGLPQNRRLLGVYDFQGSQADYLLRLRQWLQQAQDGDLLMCHPADAAISGDPISPARTREFAVLYSPEFGALLKELALQLLPLSQQQA